MPSPAQMFTKFRQKYLIKNAPNPKHQETNSSQFPHQISGSTFGEKAAATYAANPHPRKPVSQRPTIDQPNQKKPNLFRGRESAESPRDMKYKALPKMEVRSFDPQEDPCKCKHRNPQLQKKKKEKKAQDKPEGGPASKPQLVAVAGEVGRCAIGARTRFHPLQEEEKPAPSSTYFFPSVTGRRCAGRRR